MRAFQPSEAYFSRKLDVCRKWERSTSRCLQVPPGACSEVKLPTADVLLLYYRATSSVSSGVRCLIVYYRSTTSVLQSDEFGLELLQVQVGVQEGIRVTRKAERGEEKSINKKRRRGVRRKV